VDYKQTTDLLDYPACKILAKGPTQSMEYKGNLLIKKFLLTDDLTQQL
jgi:hypothetical protein